MPRPYPGLILHRASSPTGALALGLAAVAGVALGLVVPRVGPGSPPPPRAETVRALAQTPGVPAVPAPVPAGFHRVAGNLAQNAGFEEDWSHRRFSENRRFLLLQSSDLGVGEQDGVPDHWRLEGAAFPAAWDTTVRRSGSRSLRLTGGARARQWVRGAGEQFWQTGGAYYQDFLPLARDLAVQLPRRPIVVGAWCRTEGASAAQPPRLQLRLECAVRQTFAPQPVTDTASRELSVPFTGGSHGWEYREVRFEPAEWPGTPQWIILSVSGPAEGMAWFDDVSCREIPGPQEVNRVANESFEQIGPQGWPVGWRRAERWTWFRSDYYLFTGWTHSENLRTRGSAVPDPWIAFSGHRSLRCTIYPGDNLAVASDPIPLDQDRPRPIELRAMVKADRLRTLELMAQDERGEWLLQGDFLGDDMEDNPNGYKMGSTGSGTYDWQCVRKFLSPRRPVRFLRVFLCARGFDGVRVEKNQVGTVWWDDIQVRDPGPGIGVPPPTTTPGQPLSVVDLQVGDRLWGRNELRVDLSLPTPRTVGLVEETRLKLEVTGPDGQTRTETAPFRLSGDPARLPAHAVGTVPYQVERLCRNWEEQYRLRLTLTGPGGTPLLPSWESAFGTPTRMLEAGVSASCLYPGETAAAYARLNVARDSLAGFENCRLSVEGPAGVRTLREIRDLRDALTPQSAPDYLDTSRLLQAEIREAGLPVRPWREPIRDQQLRVRLVSPGGRTAAEAESVPFGFMERVPAPDLPAEIRRTGLDSRGFLTVNDRPFFPVFWTPHFGILPEANYHPKPLGYQCVDLTQVVLAGNRPPDGAVKAQLQAKVREVRNNPKLFQYELGEGEMQLQDQNWRTRVAWLKTAIPWIREADPNHLINGPESWLIGHPGHNEALPTFLPEWDVVGVEASFEQVPQLRRVTGAVQGRRSAVLVGLETYFYQEPEVLRWRGYRAVVEGAAGVGLCPSGMLQARPDRVNALRGLNAEFRSLAPFLTGNPPRERTRCLTPGVELLEREAGGTRLLIAVRAPGATGPLTARFQLPGSPRPARIRARFEGRTISPAEGVFQDGFPTPNTVRVYEVGLTE